MEYSLAIHFPQSFETTMIKFLLAFSLLIASVASLWVAGPCRTDIRPRDGFNQQLYMGLWYEFQRYELSVATIPDNECGTATYTTMADSRIRLHIESQINGVHWEAFGYGELAHPHEENIRAIWNTTFDVEENAESQLIILSTDYINYSLVWSCEDLADGNSNESFWYLSRSPGLPTRNPEILGRSKLRVIQLNCVLKPLLYFS